MLDGKDPTLEELDAMIARWLEEAEKENNE